MIVIFQSGAVWLLNFMSTFYFKECLCFSVAEVKETIRYILREDFFPKIYLRCNCLLGQSDINDVVTEWNDTSNRTWKCEFTCSYVRQQRSLFDPKRDNKQKKHHKLASQITHTWHQRKMISLKIKWLIWVSRMGTESQTTNQSAFILVHHATHEKGWFA